MEITGTGNRILEVHLTRRDAKEIRVHAKDRRMYLGAKGLGLKLLLRPWGWLNLLQPGRSGRR